MTICPTGSARRCAYAFGVCLFAVALFLLATPARAGVLDSWEGRRENANLIAKLLRERIVEPGLDILRRSTDNDAKALLRETDNFFAAAKRKTDETAQRVIANHLKAAADRMGLRKVARLGSSIREKVIDKAVEKVAGFVTDKAWNAAESAADRLASRQWRERAVGAGEARNGSGGKSSEAGTPAEAGTGGQDESNADARKTAGAVDPLIALDIHDEEQEWYRTETDVMDDTPLPEVGVLATANPEDAGGYLDGVTRVQEGEAEQDCEDVWAGCPGEEYWNKELQDKARRIDPWTEANPEDAGGYLDGVTRVQEGEAEQDCEDVWAGCPGEEYWNKELQDKARRIDLWTEYRRSAGRTAPGEEDRKAAADYTRSGSARECEDDWAGCPETGFAGGGEDRNEFGGSYRPDVSGNPDASPGGGYAAALAKLTNEAAAPSGYGSTASAGGYRAALDRLEQEETDRQRRRQEAQLRREREEAESASGRASVSSGYGSTASAGGYRAALDRLEQEETDRQRRRQEAQLRREREEAESASERASVSSGSGTRSVPSESSEKDGSDHATLSSNCEADKAPVCEQAIRTAQMQNAQLQATMQSVSSISRGRALVAQAALNGINAVRTCYSVEKRPHCKDMYQHGIRELEKTLRSAQ